MKLGIFYVREIRQPTNEFRQEQEEMPIKNTLLALIIKC